MTSRGPYTRRRVAAKIAMFHFQVLKNAKELKGLNAKAFCEEIGVPTTYGTEFTKTISLARLMKERGVRLVRCSLRLSTFAGQEGSAAVNALYSPPSERTASSATTASALFRGAFQRIRRRHIHLFPRSNCMKASIFFVI
jgi:hypothetical protein